jgi:hypothetical protein
MMRSVRSCSRSPVLGGEGWVEGQRVEFVARENRPSPQPSPPSTREREPEVHRILNNS